MEFRADLWVLEYQEISAHLRANLAQFVNWFSFFLALSFISLAALVGARVYVPGLHSVGLLYGAQIVSLLLHVLALIGIITFRHYIWAAHCRVEEIVRQSGTPGMSPIPVRFCQWMTDLMAAGFMISYFAWLLSLFFF
ncbi:MAG: hypothetical protein JO227_17250 [Acetobacteraceae bacterium]|nr:hypothetical protein [Acetobacteraceae bacterium]